MSKFIKEKKIAVIILMVISIAGTTSCKQQTEKKETLNTKVNLKTAKKSNDYMIMSVLFHQYAAEYKALCYQAFNMAKMKVDKDIANNNLKGRKKAIILDIDETILDNSPHQAKCILDTINYPAKWNEWCEMAIAEPLPGAVEFLNYAVSKGIEIFYISNRKEKQIQATMKNLIDKGFPMVDLQHLLFKKDKDKNSSKESRRNVVEKNYYVIAYLGDNLADFSKLYDNTSRDRRNNVTDSINKDFGSKFIVLPNAMYGDWEMALYEKNDSTADLKAKRHRELLKSF